MEKTQTIRIKFAAEVSILAASMALLASAVTPNEASRSKSLFEDFLSKSENITLQAKSPGPRAPLSFDVDTKRLRADNGSASAYIDSAKQADNNIQKIAFLEQLIKDNKKGILSVSDYDKKALIGALRDSLNIKEIKAEVEDRLNKNQSKNISNDKWINTVLGYTAGEGAGKFYKPATPKTTEKLIEDAAHRNGLPSVLLTSLVEQESFYRQDLVSPAGAVGLSQVLPSTALWIETGRDKFSETELNQMQERLKDPKYNLEIGSKYLSKLFNQFDGDIDLSLASYNAGPNAVQRAGGVPNYPETQKYVETIKVRMLLKTHDAIKDTHDHEATVSDSEDPINATWLSIDPSS